MLRRVQDFTIRFKLGIMNLEVDVSVMLKVLNRIGYQKGVLVQDI